MKIIAYVPVLHIGYLRFFRSNPGDILVVDVERVSSLPEYLRRDIRALPAEIIAEMLRSIGPRLVSSNSQEVPAVYVAGDEELAKYSRSSENFVMPREDVSLALAQKYFRGGQVSFDDIFLRWNMENITKPQHVFPDSTSVSNDALVAIFKNVIALTKRSFDWWRQVAAVLFRDDEALLYAYNEHAPSEQTPYIVGDPRTPFLPGERIDLTSAGHAEAAIVSTAARNGVVTLGASIFVTTFPCPTCAQIIARAGIKRLFFIEGYSLIDAEGILRSAGVEIIRVERALVS